MRELRKFGRAASMGRTADPEHPTSTSDVAINVMIAPETHETNQTNQAEPTSIVVVIILTGGCGLLTLSAPSLGKYRSARGNSNKRGQNKYFLNCFHINQKSESMAISPA
jgi:hypothetical protein